MSSRSLMVPNWARQASHARSTTTGSRPKSSVKRSKLEKSVSHGACCGSSTTAFNTLNKDPLALEAKVFGQAHGLALSVREINVRFA